MVGQRLGRWRCEVGHNEAGAAVRCGRLPWAAAARSSLRPRPRGCSDAGNGCRFRLPGFPLGCGRAHSREPGGDGGPSSPLSTSSSLKLPPLRHAFPWSFVPLSLLRVSPRPCAVEPGRVLQVFPSHCEGRGGKGNFWGLIACPVLIL